MSELKFDKIPGIVMKILMKPGLTLTFDQLKAEVEKHGRIFHDRILEEVLVEMKKRGSISFDQTSNGNLTNISRAM